MEREMRLTSATTAPVARRWRRRVLWCLVVPLYLVTWVGGWRAHARDLETSAQNSYRRLQQWNTERHEAGEEKFYNVEFLPSARAALENLGPRRRCTVPKFHEVPRHALHRGMRQLRTVVGGQLATLDLTRLHLGKPLKRNGFDAAFCPHADWPLADCVRGDCASGECRSETQSRQRE